MPLHDATRPWVSRGKELGTTPHDVMRFSAFAEILRTLNVSFDPPLAKATRLTVGIEVEKTQAKGDKRKSKAKAAGKQAGGFAPGVKEHVAREAKKASKPKTAKTTKTVKQAAE